MGVLRKSVTARLTDEEDRLLTEMAREHYPDNTRARSLMVRRLIRLQAAREQKRKELQAVKS